MDMDDEDAFLYGDESPPPPSAPPQAGTASAQPGNGTSTAAVNMTASMAASLAAYGIDPTQAVAMAVDNPEDGGVEEEEEGEEDDSDDDEDDVKIDFTGGTRVLDLRRPQAQQSNVIGIGKWAHTSTGVAPTPATTSTPTPAAPNLHQTTEYTPAPRPGTTPIPTSNLANPLIPPSGDIGTPLTLQPPNPHPNATNAPNATHALSPSTLPPVTIPTSSSLIKVDPSNPSGLIPSTGQSVYDIDLGIFEGSGQPWRRVGSNLSDYFNFGFDEVTFARFLRFRAEMEAGRNALANLPMGGMPNPDLAGLLHLSANMNPQQQQMQVMQMQQMMNGGMDGMMMNGNNMGMGMGMNMGGGAMGGGMGNMNGQGPIGGGGGGGAGGGMQRPPIPVRPTATGQGQVDGGEEIKQEEGSEMGDGNVPEPNIGGAFRGRGITRGMVPGRGAALRGRGGAVPLGPRVPTLPQNIPKGPKASRFKDVDRVDQTSTNQNTLDYGANSEDASSRGGQSRSRSPVKKRVVRERSWSGSGGEGEGFDSAGSSGRSRSRSRSRSRRRSVEVLGSGSGRKGSGGGSTRREKGRGGKEKEKERERERERVRERDRRERDKEREREKAEERKKDKRKRDDGTGSAVLGPGGWESEDAEGDRRSRRKRSEEEEGRYGRKSKKR